MYFDEPISPTRATVLPSGLVNVGNWLLVAEVPEPHVGQVSEQSMCSFTISDEDGDVGVWFTVHCASSSFSWHHYVNGPRGPSVYLERDFLSQKQADRVVPMSEVQSGWYSRYFLVPKRDGTLCPILDFCVFKQAPQGLQVQNAHTPLAIVVCASHRLVQIRKSEGWVFSCG